MLHELAAVEPLPIERQAREVVSEERLRRNVSGAVGMKEQLKSKTMPVMGKAPTAQSTLWSRSIILTDGENFTLIPVGSILHLPVDLRSRVAAKPVGEFTFWPNFLRKNSSWLEAKEVTLSMSRGNASEAKSLLRSVVRHPRLLVAVYKGGPITILEAASESQVKTKP